MTLKEQGELYIEKFRGMKLKGEMIKLYYNLKNERKILKRLNQE